MPAPSSKPRKDAVSRTPVAIKRIGWVDKRRVVAGRSDQVNNVFRRTDQSLRRSE